MFRTHHAAEALLACVEREMNSATENPLVTQNSVLHHGQSHLATLAADLERARTTLVPVLTLAANRLSLLTRPSMTGLAPFLSDQTRGSSGLMIRRVRRSGLPGPGASQATFVTGHDVHISLGVEEHTSFATQGARQLRRMVELGKVVIALEAVAAVSALRLAPDRLVDCPARAGFELLAAVISDDTDDRPIGDDAEAVLRVLSVLGRPALRPGQQR